MTGRGLAAGHDLRVTGVEPVTRSSMQRLLDALPFLIMGVVAGAALAFGPRSGLLQLLALGPAFAAVSGGLRKTIAAGVVALALNALLAADQVISTWGDYARDSAVVLGVTVAAVIACTVRQRREHELAEVRAIAEVAQQVLLGPVPDAARSVRLAVRYMSATSHARIGGDLYEVVTGSTGMRLIIGDVQGKGLVAVKTAATVLGSFREVAPEAPSLPMIADRIEIALARQLDDEQFVTAILAEVSLDGSGSSCSAAAIPRPCLSPATPGGSWSRPRRACPWAWPVWGSCRAKCSLSHSPRTTRCCSIRTGSARRGTGPVSSTRCRTARSTPRPRTPTAP